MDATEFVKLTPQELALLWELPEEDGLVICGSVLRLPAAKVREWENRVGSLDLTFADIALVTGLKETTLRKWRKQGRLSVRAMTRAQNRSLRVAPAELIRALRVIAKERGGTTELVETPAQSRRRGERAKARALAALDD